MSKSTYFSGSRLRKEEKEQEKALYMMDSTDFIAFMENPNQDEIKILAERENPLPNQLSLFH